MNRLIVPIEAFDPNRYHITKVQMRVFPLDTLTRGFRQIGKTHSSISFLNGKTTTETDTYNDYFMGKYHYRSRQAKSILVLDPDTQRKFEKLGDEIHQLNKRVSELKAKQGRLIRRNRKKFDQFTDEWAGTILEAK